MEGWLRVFVIGESETGRVRIFSTFNPACAGNINIYM
ncbi:hypothetical protein M2103_001408 [Ereboglobus sp. PH5-5]|nr:hypothetical protein [Ereboglobus sp. PH5-5]